MIVRVVLGVLVATALVASAMAPLEHARRERTSAAVADQVSTVERGADALLETDDPVTGSGARRVVTLRVPSRTWTRASVDRVAVRPASRGRPARVSWRIADGRTGRRHLSGLPLATADGEPLVLREAGTHRLALSLDGRPGAPVVTVRPLK